MERSTLGYTSYGRESLRDLKYTYALYNRVHISQTPHERWNLPWGDAAKTVACRDEKYSD